MKLPAGDRWGELRPIVGASCDALIAGVTRGGCHRESWIRMPRTRRYAERISLPTCGHEN